MDASYERYYFVKLWQSSVVGHKDFYEQLKALVPEGTKIYGGQVKFLALENRGSGETGVANYEVVLGFPFVQRRYRRQELIRKWVNLTSVRESLYEAFGEPEGDPDPEQEDEEWGDVDGIVEQCIEKRKKAVRYRVGISVSVPRAGQESAKFLENVQAYIEKDDNELLFGDRIHLSTVDEFLLQKYTEFANLEQVRDPFPSLPFPWYSYG
jgi:hypothetical protein